MSTNLNQYTNILGKYNTTLKEYREALQKNDSHAVSTKYQDLIEFSGELKTEFARIEPHLQAMKAQYHELKSANDNAYNEWETLNKQYIQTGSRSDYQKMNYAKEISRKACSKLESFEKEFKLHEFRAEIINEMNRLQKEDGEIRIYHNETRSEGDLISREQRQQDAEIYNEIRTIYDQSDSFLDIMKSNNVDQEIKTAVEYTGHLDGSELDTTVLDPHTFYRIIYGKVISKEYTNEQYNKMYKEISENLAKEPMTVAEIIAFCKDNGIPHFSDGEFRSLIKNENKDYENISQSVRDIDHGYVPKDSTITARFEKGHGKSEHQNINNIVDADSFYKFIDTKMVRGEYTSQQEYKLYVDISEVLVHSPLTKDEINEIYDKHNITPPTEREWGRLIERQELRRDTDNIAKKSGDLEFKGSVNIDFKDENFKFKVDLYHNKGQTESKEMQEILLETTKVFNESFGIRKSGDVANFRVFMFDNAEAYTEATGKDPRGHATFSDNGNTASVYLFFGDNNYNDDNDLLRHEFAHALTFHATSKLGLSRTFMEGMAEYIVGKMHGKNSDDFAKLVPERNFDKSIAEIMKYTESEDDHYQTGAAIVAYLEEKHPNFLDNLLYAANDAIKNDRHIDVMEMMNKFFQEQGGKPLQEIEWFGNSATSDQLSGQQDNEISGNAYYPSSGGYSGPPVQARSLDKQDNNAIQPEAQKSIVLNFIIERGEPINEHYFSARIKLTEDSKDLLRDALWGVANFNDFKNYFGLDSNDLFALYNNAFDGYFDLDPNTHYIWHNSYAGGYASRDELYVKDSSGRMLVNNLPLNHRGFSVEVSSDGSKIIDHGFYPLAILHNPDYYENVRAQYKNPSGLDGSKFLEGIQNVFTQVSNNITKKEDRAVEEQKQVEKEFSEKNAEFKEAINKGDIVLYKVKEGGHSSVILEMTKESQKALGINHEDSKNIKLDPSKFYTRENKAQDDPHAGKYLYSVKEYIHEGYDDLFYALNKNDPSKSGFYNLGKDKFIFPAKYLQTEPNKYIYDDDLHHKLLSNLEQSNNDVMLGDGPQIAKVSSNAIEKEVILKDTILTIGKSRTSDEHGRHKAEIKIEHSDIKSLLDSASSREEQHSILKFWHKLAENGYKIGDLSDQYYFKDGNFVMHESNGQCIKLPENAISLKLMNLNGNLELVVLNKAGEVVGNIHEVNSLSYGLLSDSDTLSHLETTDFQLSEMQSDYDHHLINGLGGEIFQNCHHDNMLI